MRCEAHRAPSKIHSRGVLDWLIYWGSFCWLEGGGDYTHCREPFDNEETRNHLKAIVVGTLSVSVANVF